jgi:ribose 5-phosphate isomerase B
MEVLKELGVDVVDFGTMDTSSVDYCMYAEPVAKAVAGNEADLGILVCGAGVGMAIAANKVPGVYAANAHDPYSAARARMSNNAQVLSLGARVVGTELAKTLVDVWLKAEFAGGGSLRKVQKIQAAERKAEAAPPPSGSDAASQTAPTKASHKERPK